MWASINEPGVGKRYFVSEALPFGASASVYSFNRVARVMHAIGVRLFSLTRTNYYDDFPQVDIGKAGDNSQVIAEKLLELIGWRYSRKETKWQPFSKNFVSNSPPRVLRAGMSKNKVITFTDAALSEGDTVAGKGMVMLKLVDGKISERAFFSERVPAEIMASLQTKTPKVICALELLAAVQAVMVCERFLFVANEGTRANLIACYEQSCCHSITTAQKTL